MEAPGSRGFPWLVAIVGVLLVLVLIAGAMAVVGLPQLGPQPTPAPAAPSGNSALMRPWVG